MKSDPEEELGSISQAIQKCAESEDSGLARIWEAYFARLCEHVRSRIFARHRRHFDEEDIANSALYALFDGLKNDRFKDIKRRDDVWQLLTTIAIRKVANSQKHFDRQKRGEGKVRGDSVMQHVDPQQIEEFIRYQAQDDFEELESTWHDMIGQLPNENLRTIARMRLAGWSNAEIAAKCGCVSRTIERKLQLIKKIWHNQFGDFELDFGL